MRRLAIVVAALAGTLICSALLVREVALAASRTVAWPAPHWWHDLLTAPAALTALAAVAAAALGGGCVWLALRMLGGGEPDEGAGIELGAAESSVLVKAAALERLLARCLTDDVAEVHSATVRVTRRDQRLVTRTYLTLTATDVRRSHARARVVIDRELRAATGLGAGDLTVEVDGIRVGRGGAP
jgi:hypothetical protein